MYRHDRPKKGDEEHEREERGRSRLEKHIWSLFALAVVGGSDGDVLRTVCLLSERGRPLSVGADLNSDLEGRFAGLPGTKSLAAEHPAFSASPFMAKEAAAFSRPARSLETSTGLHSVVRHGKIISRTWNHPRSQVRLFFELVKGKYPPANPT